MTERLRGVDLPRPEPAADKGPLDTRFYDLVEARVRRVFVDNPVYRVRCSASTPRTTGSATPPATPSSRRSPTTARTSRRSCRWTPTACPEDARFERDLEVHNLRLSLFEADEVAQLGARRHRGRRHRRRAVPPVRPRREAARRAPGAHHRPPRGGARVPRRLAIAARRARRSASGRRSRRATPGTCPGCSAMCSRRPRRRSRPPSSPGCAARSPRRTPASTTTAAGCARASPARPTTGRSAGEPYDELVRLRAFGDLDTDTILRIGEEQLVTSLEARRAAARELDPDADVHTRHRPPEVRPPGDVPRGAGRLSRRHAPGPGPHHRARHRDDPARRARRGHRDPGVPAHGDAVRGLLRAGPVRRRQRRAVHRHARRRRRPERDARALLGVDLEHEHPRGLPGPSPPARDGRRATRASPGCSPTRPSSSRAGACTASR